MATIGSPFASLRRRRADYFCYSRGHSHLARNLIIDALVSVLTVVSIFTFVNHASASARIETLRKSGVITMTAEELVAHVKEENLTVYWLGPIQGDAYAIICTDLDEILVTYIPVGTRLHDSFATAISVETNSLANKAESAQGSNAISDPDDFQFANDVRRTMEPIVPSYKVVDFPDTRRRVEIHYPTLSSLLDKRMSTSELVLIS